MICQPGCAWDRCLVNLLFESLILLRTHPPWKQILLWWGAWTPQTEALFDIHVVDTDTWSYWNQTPLIVLTNAEKEKEEYWTASEERRLCSPHCGISVDDLLGEWGSNIFETNSWPNGPVTGKKLLWDYFTRNIYAVPKWSQFSEHPRPHILFISSKPNTTWPNCLTFLYLPDASTFGWCIYTSFLARSPYQQVPLALRFDIANWRMPF